MNTESASIATIERKPLHQMFYAIPKRYDLINKLITLGLDKGWRRKAAKVCLESHPRRVLDLCCGTADLLLDVAQMADDGVELTGVDYSRTMLDVAQRKAAQIVPGRKVDFVFGDAAAIPFPNSHFDCVGISFAFRNLTYKNPYAPEHLQEALRVLRPGGRFVIVETSQPKSALVRAVYHAYLRSYVYRTGYWLSGSKGAYRYLAESARRFYSAPELRAMLLQTGFTEARFSPMLLGAVGICVAVK